MESLKKRSERASTIRTYEGHIRRPGHGQCDTTNHDPQKRVTVISNFLRNAFSVYLCRRCSRCLIPSREFTYIPTNDGPIGNSLPCYACSCSVMLASTHRRGFPVVRKPRAYRKQSPSLLAPDWSPCSTRRATFFFEKHGVSSDVLLSSQKQIFTSEGNVKDGIVYDLPVACGLGYVVQPGQCVNRAQEKRTSQCNELTIGTSLAGVLRQCLQLG